MTRYESVYHSVVVFNLISAAFAALLLFLSTSKPVIDKWVLKCIWLMVASSVYAASTRLDLPKPFASDFICVISFIYSFIQFSMAGRIFYLHLKK